jgi:hypothetical protein
MLYLLSVASFSALYIFAVLFYFIFTGFAVLICFIFTAFVVQLLAYLLLSEEVVVICNLKLEILLNIINNNKLN